MNTEMFRRVFDRHRYMREMTPYREFLQHVRARPNVWRASQGEVARWWAARDAARLVLTSLENGRLRISARLSRGVVQIDDSELHPLPFELNLGTSVRRPWLRVSEPNLLIAKAMLRHLGQGHVSLREGRDALTESYETTVANYLGQGVVAARAYPADAVDSLRVAAAEAHRRAGLPNLRIWTLPAQSRRRVYRVAYSPRFDVDKAMVNVPAISRLHAEFGVRGTFYIRPMGCFYGEPEIRRWSPEVVDDELALHGEFVTTAEEKFGDEWGAAIGEKSALQEMVGREVHGVCTHGGELRTNQTDNTPSATDRAGFLYESTFYERPYYLPMYLPCPEGIRPTLTILRHQDDVTLPLGDGFARAMVKTFVEQLRDARRMGGVFVPTMHPLYFDLRNYLAQASSLVRLAAFAPVFASRAMRMKSGQLWSNQYPLPGPRD